MDPPENPLPRPARRGALVVGALGAVALLWLVARDAWVADDAYFSYRSAWNLAHGYGPVWNVDERVQAFTNPLWVLLLSAAHRLGSSLWVATLGASLLLTGVAAVLLAAFVPRRPTPWLALAVVCILAGSRSFVDWSTSGLENPLLHALTAGFAVLWLQAGDEPKRRRLVGLGVVAAALATTRLDALLVVAPALAWLVARDWRRAGPLALGLTPLLAWESFATLYYGSPLPNTALAKLNHGLPAAEVRSFFGHYLSLTAEWDPVLLPALALGVVVGVAASWLERDAGPALLAAGAALYTAWLWGAGGDFMAGRLLTMPLVAALAAALAAPWVDRPQVALPMAAGALLLSLTSPMSPLSSGPEPHPKAAPGGTGANVWIHDSGVAYERGVYWEVSGWRRPRAPDEPADPIQPVDPPTGLPPAVRISEGGQAPYGEGPSTHHIDPLALGDAFLARLPGHEQSFRPGHVERRPPAGYLDSVRTGRNLLAEAHLARLYDDVQLATKGPLLAEGRLGAILRLARRDLAALSGR